MANGLQNYDPQAVVLVVGGQQIVGFAEGSMIECSRNSDGWTEQVGAQGDVVRNKSADKTGTIKITLQQTSPSNAILQALQALDDENGTGTAEAQITDSTTPDALVHCENAWVKKLADFKRGKESGDVEWTMATNSLQIKHAGAPYVGQ